MNKIFLDTNVLIYALDRKSQFHRAASNLLLKQGHLFFTSSKTVSEFLAVVTRLPRHPLSLGEALEGLDSLLQFATILYPDSSSFVIFRGLLKKYQPKGLRIHDFEAVSIALANKVRTVATFNIKDFAEVSEVQVFLPVDPETDRERKS